MARQRAHVEIDEAKCPPCPGLVCVGVCPQGILEPNAKGKPRVSDVSSCTECGVCANLCPSKAITINPSKPPEET
ncbi:MAG: 4Fe-4S binding protein [Candidatus Bathyarchaeia archaeon]